MGKIAVYFNMSLDKQHKKTKNKTKSAENNNRCGLKTGLLYIQGN